MNARSAITIMGLGVKRGDSVIVVAEGPDAEPAVEAVARLLTTNLGDAPGMSAASPAPERAPPPPTAVADIPATPALPAFRPGSEIVLPGVAAAAGLAEGHALRVVEDSFDLVEAGEGEAIEQARLSAALDSAQDALRATLAAGDAIQEAKDNPAHTILSAHPAFLEDPELRDQAEALVHAGKSAGFAWHHAMQEQVAALRQLGDARLAERANDLLDVEKRVLAALSGRQSGRLAVPDNSVLIADDLLPSQLTGLDAAKVAGICTRSARFVAGTRLAVELVDPAKVDPRALQAAHVRGVAPLGQGSFQLVMGPEAARYADALLPALEHV